MKSENNYIKNYLIALSVILIALVQLNAQVPGTLEKRVRVGSLQSHFTAYGFERAFTGTEYLGLKWPADYTFQDNAVIERSWIACENFTDANGDLWEKYGVYFDASTVDASTFPVVHEQIAKFESPIVYVDGIDITAPFKNEVDRYDETIVSDRIVNNVVNTRIGLTMRRKIYAFSQQYHDNYFIKEYTFKNTGNVDYDDEIELTGTLNGVRVGWASRYSTCREGATKYDNQQSWGKFSWVTKRGEDYAQHVGEVIDESNPIVDWLRCSYTWAGQSDLRTAWDNIGAPDLNTNGRLASPQVAGIGILHVDKTTTDQSDDPAQPYLMGWHASDALLVVADQLAINDAEGMKKLYNFLLGTPIGGAGNGGTNRYFESLVTDWTDRYSPWQTHNDIGGTSIWITYGPFTIPHGDSIRIIEVEAVAGLNRQMCEEIGARWLQAYNDPNDKGPFDLPGGGTTDDLDLYKNSWVYTGWDSIKQTIGRAKRNLDLDLNIPQPPQPPHLIEVTSGGDRINLTWTPSPDESAADFGGYRIFRAVGKPDTTYEEIFACGDGTENPNIVNTFDDLTPVRGFAYYYYIVAFNDGSNNTSGAANPTGQLHSSRFYTKTTEPAYLRRQPGASLDDIRVVPNPFSIKARQYNYIGEANKIGFLNIPAFCNIKIYTERGDLIYEIEHSDGSGDEFWNSITSSRQTVVSGLYIAYFEVTENYYDSQSGKLLYKKGDSTFRKFVIIR